MNDFGKWLNELGIYYLDYEQLWIAFTHSSYKGMGYEGEDNERLEFLGDAVLDLIISSILFQDLNLTESEMTEIRKTYVKNDQLAIIFDLLQMKDFIRGAKNLKLTNKIKAGVVEAFFGVIYNEKGLGDCFTLWNHIQDILSGLKDFDYALQYQEYQDSKNPKTTLQEFCRKLNFDHPKYEVIEKTGPVHAPTYKIKLILKPGSNILGFEEIFETYTIKKPYVRTLGSGKSKKAAEMNAAEEMCNRIGLDYIPQGGVDRWA